ncbi:NtaA/DmoA family FMN-dependent monooxygenase [Kineococcus sp. SYSU DK003]|uniref:NtaA/DmoA family FMN-dependent monooxygenase n=1 Tax=Kineococcus sp. SYSU DK003 TaxID=3383124 RepID=UPI003D7EF2DE
MLVLSLVVQPGTYASGAWRLPGNEVERATDLSWYTELARRAETAGFHALFQADKLALPPEEWDHLLSPLEPVSLFSALAAVTDRIGLVATLSTTYSEPYNVARQFATLDHLSRGRAGINIVTTSDPRAGANFGSALPDHARRYERADAFISVFKDLCLSWERDAIVVDRATGLQTRADRIHPVDHHSDFFHVAGPLDTPRPPQGYPVLFQAGQSANGLTVAARHAEVLFGVVNHLPTAQQTYRRIKDATTAAGRNPDHLKFVPALNTVVGSTEEEAQRLYQQVREAAGKDEYAQDVSDVLGFDISTADADRVVTAEDLVTQENAKGTSWLGMIAEDVRRTGRTTVGDLRRHFSTIGRSGHLQMIGTPEQVADQITEWYRGKAVDGFNLQPIPVPTGAWTFFDEVVPLLVKNGVFDPEPTGATFRERLGLPPVH